MSILRFLFICLFVCLFFCIQVDMPILTCIFFTFNWLTLTSEMHFMKFHPVVAFCLLSRGNREYAPLGMRLLRKYIRNYFLVYQLISPFLVYLQNYKEFEAGILDLQSEKYGLSFDIKKYTTSFSAACHIHNYMRFLKIKLPEKPLMVLYTNYHISKIGGVWTYFWYQINPIRHLKFASNLINIHKHNLHMTCTRLFLI